MYNVRGGETVNLTALLVALLIFVLVGVILSVVGIPYAWVFALVAAILYLLSGNL